VGLGGGGKYKLNSKFQTQIFFVQQTPLQVNNHIFNSILPSSIYALSHQTAMW